jgi:hypothetical protein
MKTHSIEWSPVSASGKRVTLDPIRQLPRLMQLVTRAFAALVPALAIVVGATWLITMPELVLYLQVVTWVGGFVFLALAIEAESAEISILSLATGITLPVLAWLSSHVALELVIVAAALVAAWVAAALMRR